jgi:hypothetical protein
MSHSILGVLAVTKIGHVGQCVPALYPLYNSMQVSHVPRQKFIARKTSDLFFYAWLILGCS